SLQATLAGTLFIARPFNRPPSGIAMFHSVNLSDYMLHNPAKIHQNADLFDAVAVILEGRISGLCVVDDHNNLVGVLSELDCLGATLSSSHDGGRNVGAVRDYITPVQQVAVASPGDDIVDVARDMLDRKSTRLNSSHVKISYAVFCLKKKNKYNPIR